MWAYDRKDAYINSMRHYSCRINQRHLREKMGDSNSSGFSVLILFM